MLANVLFMLPMFLGRTFDARYDRVGIEIFPKAELDKYRTIEEPEVISRYVMPDSAEDVRNLLEVPTALALRMKAGKLGVDKMTSYLKDTSKIGRTIEILIKIKVKTKTVALPPDVQPFSNWLDNSKDNLGTHFIKSVTYGGELLVSIRFKPKKYSDFNAIKAEVTSNFNEGDATNLLAEGKLEIVQNRLKDRASMEISCYGFVPPQSAPQTITDLRKLVREFDQHVKNVRDGWGVPIRVELMELSSLGGAPRFIKNRALESELSDFEQEYDDLRNANLMIIEWNKVLPDTISEDQEEEEIDNLYGRIQKVLSLYNKAIEKLNIEEGPESQIKEAREAYREGKTSALPGKFTKEFLRLQKKIVTG